MASGIELFSAGDCLVLSMKCPASSGLSTPEARACANRLRSAAGRHGKGAIFALVGESRGPSGTAEMELCVAIRKPPRLKPVDIAAGMATRTVEGGRFARGYHRGSYETLADSIRGLLVFLDEKGMRHSSPRRERYLKAPGRIFRGDPARYLTEISVPLR